MERCTLNNFNMNKNQKQIVYSGIIGDGCFDEMNGRISYNCHYKEYIDFKYSILKEYCSKGVKHSYNQGYKKGSDIYEFRTRVNDFCKRLSDTDYIKESIENLNIFGLSLLGYDDGSRHKKHNFYNISTHSLSNYHQKLLVDRLGTFNIYPEIYTETKRDGRVFSYLYISKWRGAMELSSIMRKININCYKYKLIPEKIEDAYFNFKDDYDFKILKLEGSKTSYIKKKLGVKKFEDLCETH